MKKKKKKKKCEDKLFNGDTDPRDLQFLQKEREQYINLIKKNEDELVRLMVKVDSAQIKKSKYDEQLNELEPEFNREIQDAKETLERLEQRVQELKKERRTFCDLEDRMLLTVYQRLQKENDGLAITTVSDDGVCEGCFVEISKATELQIQEFEHIVKCPRCGRILFKPDLIEIQV